MKHARAQHTPPATKTNIRYTATKKKKRGGGEASAALSYNRYRGNRTPTRSRLIACRTRLKGSLILEAIPNSRHPRRSDDPLVRKRDEAQWDVEQEGQGDVEREKPGAVPAAVRVLREANIDLILLAGTSAHVQPIG